MRRWAVWALSALLGFVVQEMAVRLALPAYDPTNHLRFVAGEGGVPALGVPNSTRRLIKNSGDYNVEVRFNRFGLRDPADIAQAGPEDVVVVGDSFAFGWGVEERDRLSNQLDGLLGRRVYNLAIPTDVAGYQGLLQWAEGQGAHFGQVVLVFNMTDDLLDYDSRDRAAASKPAEAPVAHGLPMLAVKEYLLSHSALYFLATSLVQQQPQLRELALKLGLVVPMQAVAARAVDDAALDSTAARLQRITQRWPTLVVVVPHRGIWLGSDREREVALHKAFSARLTALGLDVLDLKPVWEMSEPLAYHFVNDAHWNAAGHALAAKAIAARLSRKSLVVDRHS